MNATNTVLWSPSRETNFSAIRKTSPHLLLLLLWIPSVYAHARFAHKQRDRFRCCVACVAWQRSRGGRRCCCYQRHWNTCHTALRCADCNSSATRSVVAMSFFQRMFQKKPPKAAKKPQHQKQRQHRGGGGGGGGGSGSGSGSGSGGGSGEAKLSLKDAQIPPGYLQAVMEGLSFRVAVVGDTGTGKSSFINRIAGNAWAPELRDVAGCQVRIAHVLAERLCGLVLSVPSAVLAAEGRCT